MRYWKRTFTITVLQALEDAPSPIEPVDADPHGIQELDYLITEGDGVGMVEEIPPQELTVEEMKIALVAMGSSVSFFFEEEE